MTIEKKLKKLKNVIIKNIKYRVDISSIINQLEQLGIGNEPVRSTYIENVYESFDGNDQIMYFNIPSCFQKDLMIEDLIQFKNADEFEECSKCITIEKNKIQHFFKSKPMQKIIEINEMPSYGSLKKSRQQEIRNFSKVFFQKAFENLPEDEKATIKRFHTSLVNSNFINEHIDKYSSDIYKLVTEHHLHKPIIDMLLDIDSDCEQFLGCTEVYLNDDCLIEMQIILHMDNCWVDTSNNLYNIVYEGSNIFASIDIDRHKFGFFHPSKIQEVINKSSDIVSKCQTIKHMYEISLDGKFEWDVDDTQRYLSVEGLIEDINMQYYNIENAINKLMLSIHDGVLIVHTDQKLRGNL